MSRDDIYIKLQDILIEDLKIDSDKINPNANFYEELGMDSISIVELYAAVENKFAIDIDNISEFINSLKLLDNVVDYVWKKVDMEEDICLEEVNIEEKIFSEELHMEEDNAL